MVVLTNIAVVHVFCVLSDQCWIRILGFVALLTANNNAIEVVSVTDLIFVTKMAEWKTYSDAGLWERGLISNPTSSVWSRATRT